MEDPAPREPLAAPGHGPARPPAGPGREATAFGAAAASPRGPDSALLAPADALAGCVRAFYWRDLRGCAALTPAEAGTRVPPGPYAALVWMVEGRARLVQRGGAGVDEELPAVFLAGPHRHAYRSVAIDRFCSFGLVFQPAALGLLSGLDLGGHADRIGDARALLPGEWQPLLDAVAAASDHAGRIALCEAFLAPRWAALAAAQPAWLRLARSAWHRSAVRPLFAALNWSQRHFQRRTKQCAGLSAGEVERMLRLERALLELRDGRTSGAEAAHRHGYADQPHFIREAKAAYESPPGELVARLRRPPSDEDWLLRL